MAQRELPKACARPSQGICTRRPQTMASTRSSCCSLWDAAPAHFYPVGVAGKPWGDAERAQWLANQTSIQRSYQEEALDKLEELKEQFDVEQFGALTLDPKRYPISAVVGVASTLAFHMVIHVNNLPPWRAPHLTPT